MKTSAPHDYQQWRGEIAEGANETATNRNVKEHAGRSKTIENEEIQNWRDHLNQILTLAWE